MSKQPKVHLDRDGKPRCANPGATLIGTEEEVTCTRCLAMMNGTYGVGHRQPDDDSCGTPAAYKRHLRSQGKPVRCEPCLQAEQRRCQDWTGRDAYNARRRERYAALRAAGATSREASQRKDLRRAA